MERYIQLIKGLLENYNNWIGSLLETDNFALVFLGIFLTVQCIGQVIILLNKKHRKPFVLKRSLTNISRGILYLILYIFFFILLYITNNLSTTSLIRYSLIFFIAHSFIFLSIKVYYNILFEGNLYTSDVLNPLITYQIFSDDWLSKNENHEGLFKV